MEHAGIARGTTVELSVPKSLDRYSCTGGKAKGSRNQVLLEAYERHVFTHFV